MNKVLKGFLSLGLAIAMCFGIVAIERSVSTEYNVAYAAEGSYYSEITATSGQQLLGQVHDLITKTHKKYTSYSDCSNPTYVKKTDPGTNSSSVMEFYSQANISSTWGSGKVGTWNREHVWCQSLSNGLWGTSGGGSDMHHIRPVETRLNSTRGNDKYGLVSNRDSNKAYYKDGSGNNVAHGGYSGSGTFEPLDEVKGDVARIVMYVYTHYNTYSNSIFGGYATTNGSGSYCGTLKFTNVISASSETAAIRLLLEWNKNDPVDDIERTRNEAVYEIQGNRNPFIDHPEYVNAIWGGDTVTPDPSVQPEKLTLSPASVSLTVGKTQTLSVTATPSNANKSVSWSTSNSTVATVSNGVVTAKAEGTATITATSTVNSNVKATATVTVTKASSTVPAGSATININSFSSLSGSYGFQSWSSGDISGIAYIYGGNKTSLQFNNSKDSYYIASNVASSAPIKEVTINLNSSTNSNKNWKLLTSNSAYVEVDGKPTNGTDQGTKTVPKSGSVTWTLSGDDTYFALTYEDSGACYIDSVVIAFGNSGNVGGGDEKHACEHVCDICNKCMDMTCNNNVCAEKCAGHDGENAKLQAFHWAVESIVTEGPLAQRLASINKAINAYKTLSDADKALAADDIAALQAAIDDYNKTVRDYNDDAKNANEAVSGGSKR